MGIGLHTSITNLPHVDRIPNDSHKFPMVHQESNAHSAREESAKRTLMPTEPDKAEGKKTDPRDRRRQQQRQGDRKKPSPGSCFSRPHDGSIIDVDA